LSSSRTQLQEFLAKSFVKGHHDFNRKLVLPRPNDAPPNLLQTHVLEILLKNSTLAHQLSVLQFCNNRHGNTHENTHTHIDIKCTPCHGLEDGILTGGERELARQQDVENDP
jgi:hypothetical protein